MKTLFLFTLTTLMALHLSARDNPFIPTSAYEEETARLIELNEQDNSPINEEAYIKEMQEKMMSEDKAFKKNNIKVEDGNKNEVKKPEKKVYSQKEVKTLIEKAKKQTVNETKQIIKKEIATVKQQKPEQIVYVKPRADVKEEAQDLKTVKVMDKKPMMNEMKMHTMNNMDKMHTKKLLPFLSISYNNKMLKIDTKSKMIKNFSINKSMKIIIDYKAKTNFYTKRADLMSDAFKKITIGNHNAKGFYRVVLELKAKPSMYKISKDMGMVTITKK